MQEQFKKIVDTEATRTKMVFSYFQKIMQYFVAQFILLNRY